MLKMLNVNINLNQSFWDTYYLVLILRIVNILSFKFKIIYFIETQKKI